MLQLRKVENREHYLLKVVVGIHINFYTICESSTASHFMFYSRYVNNKCVFVFFIVCVFAETPILLFVLYHLIYYTDKIENLILKYSWTMNNIFIWNFQLHYPFFYNKINDYFWIFYFKCFICDTWDEYPKKFIIFFVIILF